MVELRVIELASGTHAIGVLGPNGQVGPRPYFLYDADTPFEALALFIADCPEIPALSCVNADFFRLESEHAEDCDLDEDCVCAAAR